MNRCPSLFDIKARHMAMNAHNALTELPFVAPDRLPHYLFAQVEGLPDGWYKVFPRGKLYLQ